MNTGIDFGSHNIQELSLLYEELLASQEGFCCMELY